MLILSAALALATPVLPTDGASLELTFGERSFGLDRQPTWTVYRGRHYLTAPQFAEVVGDGATASLLALERRRQSFAAVVFVFGGSTSLTVGTYLALFGELAAGSSPRLRTVMIGAGTAMMVMGATAYYATLSMLLIRVPRRNRVDRYYTREEAESWVRRHHGAVEVRASVGPGSLDIEARF